MMIVVFALGTAMPLPAELSMSESRIHDSGVFMTVAVQVGSLPCLLGVGLEQQIGGLSLMGIVKLGIWMIFTGIEDDNVRFFCVNLLVLCVRFRSSNHHPLLHRQRLIDLMLFIWVCLGEATPRGKQTGYRAYGEQKQFVQRALLKWTGFCSRCFVGFWGD
jgi:hypothetical protein